MAELAPKIEAAQTAATEETVQRLGVSMEQLTERTDRLRALDGIFQQQIGALQRIDELVASRADLDLEIETFEERGPEEAPPYELNYADQLHDDILTERRNLDSLTSQLESVEAELSASKERLDESQRARRASREAAETNADPAKTPRLTWEVNRAMLEEQYQEESIVARRLRQEAATAERAISELRLELAQRKFESVLELTEFGQEELDQRLIEVAERRDSAENKLPKLRDAYQADERLRSLARDELQAAQGDETIAIATAKLAARTASVETSSRAVELTEKKLLFADAEKLLWDRRYAVWHDASDSDLGDWSTDTRGSLEEIERDRKVQESRLIDLRANVSDAEKQLANLTGPSEIRPIVESKLKAFHDREAILDNYLATLLSIERLATRLSDDIDRERALVTWSERWIRTQGVLSRIWNFEIFALEDDSITVRKIVTAIIILFFGFYLAGFVTRSFRKRLLDRTPLNENAAAAVEKLAYYFALILVVLYTLNFVSIPLTLFAFFGGAIAIAIGFGAQHIINNFISGFILMLERPIRIGDLVELNGIYGHIRHIGARSTRLHTAENIDLLIPNSQLLENVVTNWTLTDEKLRTRVTVGVVYGSPTDLVTELLMQATTGSKRVLESPKPVILFTEFGDNALSFEIHFWVKMRRIMDKRQVESEVRYNIDRLFRAHDIVIAFPQRDIHLDSVKPIEIRMVEDRDDH